MVSGGPTTPAPGTGPCPTYAVVSVRGTGESLTDGGLLRPVAEGISAALTGQVSLTELPYPAAFDFDVSPPAGVILLIELLNGWAGRCPGTRTVLLGYSQGAVVIGDTLANPDARMSGPAAGTLTPSASDQVIAVVLFGDPRFVGSEPFNHGSFDPAEDGVYARRAGDLAHYAARIRSFCVFDDFACQVDGSTRGHIAYFTNGMTDEGVAFALARAAQG